MAQLRHKNIVLFLGANTSPPDYYIVTGTSAVVRKGGGDFKLVGFNQATGLVPRFVAKFV